MSEVAEDQPRIFYTVSDTKQLKLISALVRFQATVPSLTKDSTARITGKAQYTHKYASLDEIIETIQPVLAECKLAVFQPVTVYPDMSRILVETVVVHEDGGVLAFKPMAMGVDTSNKSAIPHAIASAITYGKRYHLVACLRLACEEDTDGVPKQNYPQGSTAQRDRINQQFSQPASRPAAQPQPSPSMEELGNRLLGEHPQDMPYGDASPEPEAPQPTGEALVVNNFIDRMKKCQNETQLRTLATEIAKQPSAVKEALKPIYVANLDRINRNKATAPAQG